MMSCIYVNNTQLIHACDVYVLLGSGQCNHIQVYAVGSTDEIFFHKCSNVLQKVMARPPVNGSRTPSILLFGRFIFDVHISRVT